MRVTYPAVLDDFTCTHDPCPCQAARSQPISGHPGRASLHRALQPVAPTMGPETNDFPFLATQVADGVLVSVDALCPSVRRLLLATHEPVTPALAQDGWRHAVQVWRPDGDGSVRLTPDTTITGPTFTALRDLLLELAAEPTLPLLGRLARIAHVGAIATTEGTPPTSAPPLTPHAFLQFRAFVESRTQVVEMASLATHLAHAQPFLTELDLTPTTLAAWQVALHEDWRATLRTWVVPVERELTSIWQVWLGLRMLAMAIDRDVSVARALAELTAAVAATLRLLGAWGAANQAMVTPEVTAAALAIGQSWVAVQDDVLAPFAPVRSPHDRGPRMADLDLSLDALC